MPAMRPADSLRDDETLDDLRPETPEEARLADFLVRLVGGHLLDTMDVEDPANVRYLEWAAADAHAQLTPAERVTLAEEARAFATRMRAELEASGALPSPKRVGDAPVPEVVRGRVRERAPRTRRRTPMPVACFAGEPEEAPARDGGTSIRDAIAAAARVAATPYLDLAVCAGAGRALWDEPCDRWLALPPGVAAGEHVALPVRGDSMQPLLHDGDTLLVRVGSACVTGDVVVARQPDDGYVVKRVGGRARDGVRLVADNARYPDVLLPDDPSLVVGVVVLRWCPHGTARVT